MRRQLSKLIGIHNMNGYKKKYSLFIHKQRIFTVKDHRNKKKQYHTCLFCGEKMQIKKDSNSCLTVHNFCWAQYRRLKKRGVLK